MHDVCVVIPVFNEAAVVRGVVEGVLAEYPCVVCVDDGSSDESVRELRRTKAIVLRHPINVGQGAALQTGIEYGLSHTDCRDFVTFDSDGQHDVADVEAMLRTLRDKQLDIVLGSRFLAPAPALHAGDAAARPPLLRRAMLRAATVVTRLETGLRLTDTHNGLRAFTRRVARELDIRTPGMGHASEILARIAERGYSYEEVPVTIRYSEYARGKGQSLFNAVNLGVDLLFRGASRKR